MNFEVSPPCLPKRCYDVIMLPLFAADAGAWPEKGTRMIEDKTVLSKSIESFAIDLQKIYPRSFCSRNGLTYGLIRMPEGPKLAVLGEKSRVLADPFRGACHHRHTTLKACDLSQENTECLMTLFPWTRPVSLRGHPVTVGTGDRLGTATPGHLRAIRPYKARPILAQQSIRENKQTGRDYPGVVRDAAWGVFQENYEEGYGADGDHLKAVEEVKTALDAGVSMITLDLSEKLNPFAYQLSKEQLNGEFERQVDRGDAEVLLHLFLDKEFRFSGDRGPFTLRFDGEMVKRNALLFHQALDFTEEVFQYIRSRSGMRPLVDFEVSIDETPFPTSPEHHLFFTIASAHRGVRMDSLAPRFVGEFQKGIDYRGPLEEFRRQFYQHALIARDHGGYKLSIHSGSDKFSIFPAAGELVKSGLHLKTAGTSWLEAMRLIALVQPSLFREMHRFAFSAFNEAAKLYRVTTDLQRIPKLEALSDRALPTLLDQEDARQLLHITYGFLLNAKTPEGKSLFRDRFYRTLSASEEDYWSLLERHLGRHLASLGVEKGEEP